MTAKWIRVLEVEEEASVVAVVASAAGETGLIQHV